MNTIKSQKGQALIIIAFAMVGLIGFSALAIDGGRVLSDRRHAQNAADTAAFAAALAKVNGENFTAAAQARATSNGYDGGAASDVQVNNPPVSGPFSCASSPATCGEYIQVIITSYVPTTFARVIGRQQVTNVVEAVARAQTNVSSPLHGGAAMVALKPDGTGFQGSGNGFLDVNGSGIFSNSDDACSMVFTGTIDFYVDTSYATASPGTICKTGGVDLNGPTTSGSQVPYPPTEYNVPPPTVTCSGPGSIVGNQIFPGNHGSLNLSGDYEFMPGNHCFSGSVRFTGGDITANDVNFRIDGGDFSTNGNSSFTCSNMMVYGVGGSGMSFNGNGNNTCTGVTFYMESGGVTWNGNVSNDFSAPTTGNYDGLLVYSPYGNSSDIVINGNSGSEFTGSIIGISAPIAVNGNSYSNGLHTMIIGYEIAYTGNGDTTIEFIADEQYIPPANPTIELTE